MPHPRFSMGFDNKNLPLDEAIRRLSDNIDEWTGATITVIPPLPSELSDEDSGDEDDNFTTINNLTGRFLQEDVELSVTSINQEETLDDMRSPEAEEPTLATEEEKGPDDMSDDTEEPTSPTRPKRSIRIKNSYSYHAAKKAKTKAKSEICANKTLMKPKKKKAVKKESAKKGNDKPDEADESKDGWKFEKRDFNAEESERIPYTAKGAVKTDLQLSPVNFFELFFDDTLINHIVLQTNNYAAFKGDHRFSVTDRDIKAFITILMLSSYVDVYSKEQYWSVDCDTRNELIMRMMTRNRFRDILRYLHLADNNAIDEEDRFFKVRRYLEIIRERCLKYYLMQNTLSVDETMVPYFGRHSLKQYIKGKPIKFGFKLWALASHDGYVINFIPYAGKSHQYEKFYGVGGSAVRELVEPLPLMDEDGRAIFIDNLFTSFELLTDMGSKGYAVTGTLRRNRKKGAPTLDIDKADRGTSDVHICEKNDSAICLVQWKDNKTCLVASNKFGLEPQVPVQRYSKSERKHVSIDCPQSIKLYNSGMGGVDLCDQVFSTYRINIRKKSWWFKLFNHGLNMALNYAYYLYKHSDSHCQKTRKSYIDFLREIVLTYGAQYKCRTSMTNLFGVSGIRRKPVPEDVRFDGLEQIETQRRCALCNMKVKFICSKCNKGLHIKCFKGFHSK
ncbi:hypothetical protein ACHWQZ_G011882 [Mnemiopsis leidyi]